MVQLMGLDPVTPHCQEQADALPRQDRSQMRRRWDRNCRHSCRLVKIVVRSWVAARVNLGNLGQPTNKDLLQDGPLAIESRA